MSFIKIFTQKNHHRLQTPASSVNKVSVEHIFMIVIRIIKQMKNVHQIKHLTMNITNNHEIFITGQVNLKQGRKCLKQNFSLSNQFLAGQTWQKLSTLILFVKLNQLECKILAWFLSHRDDRRYWQLLEVAENCVEL